MICPTCKSPNQPGGRFCTACGSQLMLTCSACGFPNTPSDRFCGGCGKAAEAVAMAEPTVHHAVVQRRAGDGERRRVTVLFADLKDSTAAIEGLDPEAALGQIEPAVQIMMRLVHRYEGVVCRRLGDGILALFGAPVAHEDSVVSRTHAHGLAKVWLAEALDVVERGAPARSERGTLAHCWKAKGGLAWAAGDLVEAEIQYRRGLTLARQLSMAPVREACEAALAALAALQTDSSVERNVEV